MRRIIKNVFIMLAICLASCSEDGPDMYRVSVEASVSTDDDVWIDGITDRECICFQKEIKRTFTVEGRNQTVRMRCSNRKALMTLKIWVDKKKVCDEIGNSYLVCNYLPLE